LNDEEIEIQRAASIGERWDSRENYHRIGVEANNKSAKQNADNRALKIRKRRETGGSKNRTPVKNTKRKEYK
jgi:hypothetical protein